MTKLFANLRLEADPTSQPGRRVVVWLAALLVAFVLGYLRVLTGAEFTFASAVIFPVLGLAWLLGVSHGVWFSAMAALVWAISEALSDRAYTHHWIPWLNGVTQFLVYGVATLLATALRDALLREQQLARHDALTGLLNRRAFFEIGQEEADRAGRYGRAMGVAFLDLDNFKRLNDTQGHEVGDQALQAVASTLSRSLRSTDRLARLGGDEFAIVLPESSFAASSEVCQKLATAVDGALAPFPPVSVSIGLAWFERPDRSFAQMLTSADQLMYRIKQSGRQGVRCERMAGISKFSPSR